MAELPPEELVMLGSFYHTDVAFGQFMRELNVMIDHGIIGRSEKEAQKVGQTLRVIDAEDGSEASVPSRSRPMPSGSRSCGANHPAALLSRRRSAGAA